MPPPRKPPPAVAQAKGGRIAPPAVRFPHPPAVAQSKQGGVPPPPVRFHQGQPAPGRPPIAQAKAGAGPAPQPRFHERAAAPPPGPFSAGGVLQARLSYVRGYGSESWQGWLARESLLAVFAPLALSPWRDDAARRAWLRIERTYDEISEVLSIVRNTPASDGEAKAAAVIEEKREAIAASPVPYSRREAVRDRLATLLDEAKALRRSQLGRQRLEAEAEARLAAEKLAAEEKVRADHRQRMRDESADRKREEQRRREQSERAKLALKAARREEHERNARAAEARRAERAEQAEQKDDDGREVKEAAGPPPAPEPPAPQRTWWAIFTSEDPNLGSCRHEGDWMHGGELVDCDLGVFGYPEGLSVHIHFRHGSRKILKAHTRGGTFGNNNIYSAPTSAGTSARDIPGARGTALGKCAALKDLNPS